MLDVFTDTPLEGNPLAVFRDGTGVEGAVMQRVAQELNLSETVFMLPAQEDEHATVRIFTPGAELPFAGHPVLGTALLLALETPDPVIRLRTGAGLVPVTITHHGGRPVSGEMEQPLPSVEPFGPEAELLAALGVGGAELPIEVYTNGPRHVFVVLASEAAVSAVKPDMAALAALGQLGVSCVAGYRSGYRSGSGRGFRSRMFGPGLGVPEDPATGSAAGPLAVHLARHGVIGFGDEIEIDQGVEMGRPSRLRARVEGSPARLERVLVAGSAVLVGRGEFRFA